MTQREAGRGWIGKELISFIAASTVLCFRFMTKTVWKTNNSLNITYHWAVSRPSVSHSAPTVRRQGGGQEGGKVHSQDFWPNLTMEYSIKYSNKKLGSCFPHVEIAWRLSGASHCWWAFLLLTNFYSYFLHLLNSLNLDLWVFSWFCPSDSLPFPLAGEWEQECNSKKQNCSWIP